jgi:hypothetical protein
LFHYILNGLEQIYHGESGQPPNEWGLVPTCIVNPLLVS